MGVKNGYYSNNDILDQAATYNILIGGRDLGKSYSTKLYALQKAFETKQATIAYIRRWRDDIKADLVEAYFADMPIKKITKNEYSMISAFRGRLYFANLEDDGKVTRGLVCGNFFALNNAERYKSTMYPQIDDIIYEEFISDTYLRDEPHKLQNFVSTIARDKHLSVWMIGNTISRVCPYYTEWSLDNISRMKMGDIDIYKFDDVKIAVEYCPDRQDIKNKMFFGKSVKSIVKGAWECDSYRHLDKDIKDYDVLYQLGFTTAQFRFNIKLLMDEDANKVVYIYPATRDFNRRRFRVLGEENEEHYINDKIKSEAYIKETIKSGFPCFSDNLTGQDFWNSLKNIDKNPFK